MYSEEKTRFSLSFWQQIHPKQTRLTKKTFASKILFLNSVTLIIDLPETSHFCVCFNYYVIVIVVYCKFPKYCLELKDKVSKQDKFNKKLTTLICKEKVMMSEAVKCIN